MFEKVICGIDGTRQSFDAARQAARLSAPGGSLALVSAVSLWDALRLGRGEPLTVWDISTGDPDAHQRRVDAAREEALARLDRVADQLGDGLDIDRVVLDATPAAALAQVAAERAAQLVVVGVHENRRLVGVASGSTMTTVLHEAAQSVLVARQPFDPAGFPGSIVVGLDGSEASRRAVDVAARIADASGASLRAIVGGADDTVDADAARRACGVRDVVIDDRRPVDALVSAADDVDLIVLGSRGLRGARALGSVSERVAHRAACSVLVVRD